MIFRYFTEILNVISKTLSNPEIGTRHESHGILRPWNRNSRDSWDFGQISLGVSRTGSVKFCCPRALGQFWTTAP